jgi:general transcription factor 3C polypeptide 5 (transcription factor C subunit 1)
MDSDSPAAPEHPLPPTHFYSVEYPGYVQPSSVPLAVRTLGGQSSLESAFKRNATKTETLLELNFRPGNPFSHPVPGDVVATNNILMKVVKRKRRRLDGEDNVVGEYTAEAVGVIPKTARFRSKLALEI